MMKEAPEKGILIGNVPLAPIQEWFFSRKWSNIHHYNQSTLLEIKDRMTLHMVRAIFNVIAQYHDVFRIRYKSEDGKYVQSYTDDLDIEVEEKEISPEKIPEDATKIQGSLDIFNGSIVKVVLYRCSDGKDRLLIVAHHLVVDGVSWRILMDDMETVYGALMETGRVMLPAKTYSYRQWVDAQMKYAESEDGKKEAEYWKEVEKSTQETFLLLEGNGGNNSYDCVIISLSEEETKKLIQETPKKYDAQINDVLLTVLTLAAGDISGKYEFSFTLEGHGREDIIDLDVSRTIGWFTSMFPVFLTVSDPKNLAGSINEVKDLLKKIPNKGVGYGIIKYYTKSLEKPLPKVSFNYLGQWDAGIAEEGVFQYAKESSGYDCDTNNESCNLIDMNGGVKNGIFEMCFAYEKSAYELQTVEKFAHYFKERLLDVIGK